ncbi:MAG: WYL domain-containing protein [Aquisalimonadaceae bacterium]
MNRLERFVRIHRILKSPRPVPIRRFTEELGISRTTVTRDVEYLRELLGAPVIYNRDADGHHYNPDTEGFERPGFWLNQPELYALLATEQLLESTQLGVWKGETFEQQVPYPNPTELIMKVLRYGPDVEVLAPDVLRNQVAQRLRRAVKKY